MGDGWTLDGNDVDPDLDKDGFRTFHLDDEVEYVDVEGMALEDFLDAEEEAVRFRSGHRMSFDLDDEWDEEWENDDD